jgi:hypothetical protein
MKTTLVEIKRIINKADIILIVLLMMFSAGFYYLSVNKSRSTTIEIYQNTKLVKTVKSSEEQIINLPEGIVVEVKAGKARITESSCKHQICVQQGWNDRFPIVCIPNKTTIVFQTKDEEKMLITK